MAKKRATLTDLLNDLTFKVLYEKYKLIAVNAFEWEGLPEGMQARHIEKVLFDHGKAIFFKDPGMSYMCLEVQNQIGYNVYGDPLNYTAFGYGYTKTYPAEKCVIIENNKLRLATHPFIMFYVNKLTEAERTMDVNVKACKTPIIFTCDDKDSLSFKRIFQQVDGNVPAIFADRALNSDSIQAFDTKASFLGNDLMDYKRAVESELLTFLGQNNVPVDKKERLITDEAESNNQLIESFFDLQLEARERACEEINAMFPDIHISVKPRQRLSTNDSQGGGKDDSESITV